MASSQRARVPSASGFEKEDRRLIGSKPLGDENCESTGTACRTDVDKDFLCPICFQTMEDAFLTSCGHSFCYTCITTHLNNRRNCPSCARYLTAEQLIPNFLLMKVSFTLSNWVMSSFRQCPDRVGTRILSTTNVHLARSLIGRAQVD